jgi:hypothetical protein
MNGRTVVLENLCFRVNYYSGKESKSKNPSPTRNNNRSNNNKVVKHWKLSYFSGFISVWGKGRWRSPLAPRPYNLLSRTRFSSSDRWCNKVALACCACGCYSVKSQAHLLSHLHPYHTTYLPLPYYYHTTTLPLGYYYLIINIALSYKGQI